MYRLILLLPLFLLLSTACAPGTAGRAAPATRPAVQPALQAVSFLRTRVAVASDVLKVLVEPDGSYQIIRRGGGGANSSTRGRLTETQRRDLAAAMTGWNQLESYYSPPGGVEEDFRFEIDYGGKTIVASDAAKHLPPQIREIHRQLRSLVSAAGML